MPWPSSRRALILEPIHIDGTTISGSASVGVFFGGDADQSISDRMIKADLALYQAKMDGRNTYTVYTAELEIRIAHRRKVEAAILAGIDRELFTVHFQPLMRQTTKECVGFEALLRLTDVDGDSIAPAEFIPIAESIGAIKQIGAGCWHAPRKQRANGPSACSWRSTSPRDSSTMRSWSRPSDASSVTLASTQRLELEITESLLMENTLSVGNQLAALRALGVSIAMTTLEPDTEPRLPVEAASTSSRSTYRFVVGLQEAQPPEKTSRFDHCARTWAPHGCDGRRHRKRGAGRGPCPEALLRPVPRLPLRKADATIRSRSIHAHKRIGDRSSDFQGSGRSYRNRRMKPRPIGTFSQDRTEAPHSPAAAGARALLARGGHSKEL